MQEGDPGAFQEFARTWYPRIVEWIAPRTSHDKVMDYAQEVWVHLTKDGCRNLIGWRGLYVEGDSNPHSLAAYLKTVTVRKVIDLHKADNKHWLDFGDPPDIKSGENPPETIEDDQIRIGFRECFSELPRLDKRMLIMKWNGRSDEAIGQFYRKTANNIRQRRYQMILKLRECLSVKLPAYFGHD